VTGTEMVPGPCHSQPHEMGKPSAEVRETQLGRECGDFKSKMHLGHAASTRARGAVQEATE
jgi:hypothetical protein